MVVARSVRVVVSPVRVVAVPVRVVAFPVRIVVFPVRAVVVPIPVANFRYTCIPVEVDARANRRGVVLKRWARARFRPRYVLVRRETTAKVSPKYCRRPAVATVGMTTLRAFAPRSATGPTAVAVAVAAVFRLVEHYYR